ncbi:ClpP/crotonase-like domain-containing protein [Xylogone sp. PMI_703]|nr:ClpP/crotonase-like domain-containing protein [Xylogone sp. PMI_703]
MHSPTSNIQVRYPWRYVLHIQLIQPTQSGSLENVFDELGAVFTSVTDDNKVKAVILSGVADATLQMDLEDAESVQKCIFAVESCKKPVVCITEGVCSATSTALACVCDVRISTSDTTFMLKGAIPSSINIIGMLAKQVCSSSWIRDISLTGRKFQADEACRFGFTSYVHESKAKAFEKARHLSLMVIEKNLDTIQTIKATFVRELQTGSSTTANKLSWYTEAQADKDLDQVFGVGTLPPTLISAKL